MDQALQDISSGSASSVRVERDEFGAKLDFSIERAQRSLIEQQHAEGYWHAALEANAQMNAEYIIFMHYMETVDKELEERLKKVLIEAQNADGSWSIFPGGEGYLSVSIEAYFALKLCGMRAGDEPMMQARRWILSKGGIEKCGTLARFLSRVHGPGAVGSDRMPAGRDLIVPELVFLQHVRTRVVGARDRLRADAAAGGKAGGDGRLSGRRARAVHSAAALHQV